LSENKPTRANIPNSWAADFFNTIGQKLPLADSKSNFRFTPES
jgi:hypothetical protein